MELIIEKRLSISKAKQQQKVIKLAKSKERIESYFSDRFQYVKSGVSQGRDLGPLPFILFMRDVTIFKSIKILCDDDLNLLSKVKSI